jgi:hypothetical protein
MLSQFGLPLVGRYILIAIGFLYAFTYLSSLIFLLLRKHTVSSYALLAIPFPPLIVSAMYVGMINPFPFPLSLIWIDFILLLIWFSIEVGKLGFFFLFPYVYLYRHYRREPYDKTSKWMEKLLLSSLNDKASRAILMMIFLWVFVGSWIIATLFSHNFFKW